MKLPPSAQGARSKAGQWEQDLGNRDPGENGEYHDHEQRCIEKPIDSCAPGARRHQNAERILDPVPIEKQMQRDHWAEEHSDPLVANDTGPARRLQNRYGNQEKKVQPAEKTDARHALCGSAGKAVWLS
jgi:hypothetical protein